MIGFVTWPPYDNDGTKRWPSDKANHSCEKSCDHCAIVSNFLASLDIKVFGRT